MQPGARWNWTADTDLGITGMLTRILSEEK
jgi:hypothetical protein